MLWNIAYRTLLYDRGKLAAGLLGVIFSVVLVNVQGGLFLGLIAKASILIDNGQADIWVGHRGMHNVDFPHSIPENWLYRIRSIEGIDSAEPIKIGFSEISLPGGGYEGVTVVGVPAQSKLGRAYGVVEGSPSAIDYVDGVVVDKCDDHKLRYPKLGDVREIGGKRARIAGKCNGVLSFLVTPYIFTEYSRSLEFLAASPKAISYILVETAAGADKSKVCNEIEARLSDASAMTAEEYSRVSANFWMSRTGIGLSFGTATLLGLLVGVVMVAQSLYAMVLDRINEFATLKALGSTEKEIFGLLAIQSTLIAVAGISIGSVLTWAICTFLSTPRATIHVPLTLCVGSSVMIYAICLVASALPYLRVRRVDPHTVFQG